MIYVILLYEVSRGLNLNLSSVGGRSLKLTDYYRAEARRYLPDRAKTEVRPCEAEARPSQLKKTASRPPRAEADASRTTSLDNNDRDNELASNVNIDLISRFMVVISVVVFRVSFDTYGKRELHFSIVSRLVNFCCVGPRQNKFVSIVHNEKNNAMLTGAHVAQ